MSTGRREHSRSVSGTLGSTLRQWRDRTDPAAVGLPVGHRRRSAGLRREELAMLAGISVDYVVRLEQGRARSPSAQVVAALARALRLSGPERRHLYLLAGQPVPTGGRLPSDLPAGVQRLLGQWEGALVSVYDAAWTLLAGNRLHAALLGDPAAGQPPRERNVLWRHFTGRSDPVRRTVAQQGRFEQAVVADLRATAAQYPHDHGVQALVTDLRDTSRRFARLWDSHRVGSHTAGRRAGGAG